MTYATIPSDSQWLSDTTRTTFKIKHSRSNPALLKIDAALKEYNTWKLNNSNGHDATHRRTLERQEAILLLNIAKLSSLFIYMKAREMSSSMRKKWAGSFRGIRVHWLRSAAVNRLNKLQRSTGLEQLTADNSDRYFIRQLFRIRVGNAAAAAKHVGYGRGKALDMRYWQETNIGGTNPRHLQGNEIHEHWEQSEHRFLADSIRETDATEPGVVYYDNSNQWRNQVSFNAQGQAYRFADRHGVLEASPLHITGMAMAISLEGHLFVGHTGQTQHHHSSYLGGKSVLFAGGIDTNQTGQISKLDNGSGHYKPRKEDFIAAIRSLDELGADLRIASINFFEAAPGYPGFTLVNEFPNAIRWAQSHGTLQPRTVMVMPPVNDSLLDQFPEVVARFGKR